MSVDRRKLFSLGGLGAFTFVGGVQGPEFDHIAGGLTIRIYREFGGEWKVVVPDWDYVNGGDWRPGKQLRTKGMPLAEFLAHFDDKEIA